MQHAQINGFGWLVDDFVKNGWGGVAAERLATAQGFIEHHADRKEIAAWIRLATADVFRSHVAYGAHHHSGGRHVGIRNPRHTKIHHLRPQFLAVALNADVCGLDIAVHDALAMGEVQPVANLAQDFQHFYPGQGLVLQ